ASARSRGGLAAVTVKGKAGVGGPSLGPGGRVEAGVWGADEGGAGDVVTPASRGRAVAVPVPGGHGAHHHPVGALPGHIALQLLARVVAGRGPPPGGDAGLPLPPPPPGLRGGRAAVRPGGPRHAGRPAARPPPATPPLGTC